MHERFQKRLDAVVKEREQALCGSLVALARTMDANDRLPPVLGRSLRELAAALSSCPRDEQGQLMKLRLIRLATPILNQLMVAFTAQYRKEASTVLVSMSGLLAQVRGPADRRDGGAADNPGGKRAQPDRT